MRRILVVKTGETLEALRQRRGDFEDWVARGLGLARAALDVARVDRGDGLPDPDAPAAIVVTGSSAFVSDREGWSEQTAAWLGEAARVGTPVLGICYGHQLLAHALGGEVGDNPRGREVGTIGVRLRPEARGDPLLDLGRERFLAQATHVQSVLRLPAGARHLAESAGDPIQAFAWGERAWGVQFHPEFDADVMRGYLEGRHERIEEEGLDVTALHAAVRGTPLAALVLRRFAELVRSG